MFYSKLPQCTVYSMENMNSQIKITNITFVSTYNLMIKLKIQVYKINNRLTGDYIGYKRLEKSYNKCIIVKKGYL